MVVVKGGNWWWNIVVELNSGLFNYTAENLGTFQLYAY